MIARIGKGMQKKYVSSPVYGCKHHGGAFFRNMIGQRNIDNRGPQQAGVAVSNLSTENFHQVWNRGLK
ncbi:MAG TPA: hypothetical protein DEA96_06255 [Leptospiraceae bacterium]|nr:hypothetical protein [Spirochaetaceae bacterium]HBS04546.1 hypothetical protein [Leptospiraceae bacterium]